MTPNREKGILASIVLAAFVLRALFIGHESLWPDEALYLYISKNLALDPLALKDVHGEWFYQNPPFFLYILSLLMRIEIFQPQFLAHLLTVSMDTGIVLISFFIAKKVFGTTVGLLSAALLAVNPLHWWTSSRVLLDVPLTFFIYLALLALILNRYLPFYSLSFISLLTKYPAAPLFFLPLIQEKWINKNPKLWFLAYVSGLLAFILILPLAREVDTEHLRTFVNIFRLPNMQQVWIETKYFLGVPISFFFIVGFITALRNSNFSPLLSWLILFGTARIFIPWQAFRMSRYTLPLYPAIIIFAAYGGVVAFRFLEKHWPGKRQVLAIISSVLLLYTLTMHFHKGYTASYNTTQMFVGFGAVQNFFRDESRNATVLTSSPRQIKYMVPELEVHDLPGNINPEQAEHLIETNYIDYILLDRWSPHQPNWALKHFSPDNGYQAAFATEHLIILAVKDKGAVTMQRNLINREHK